MITKHDQNLPHFDIAAREGVSISTVERKLKNAPERRKWTPEDIQKIIFHMRSGMSAKEIIRLYNLRNLTHLLTICKAKNVNEIYYGAAGRDINDILARYSLKLYKNRLVKLNRRQSEKGIELSFDAIGEMLINPVQWLMDNAELVRDHVLMPIGKKRFRRPR